MSTAEPTESKARKLFEMALAKPPAERRAFLDGLGGTNAELRRRVEALLKAHDELGEFLAEPTAGADGAVTASEGEGAVIGNYKLLQSIGEGGMGTVWMAEQFEPVRRKVALKIIKLGMDTKQVVARFEAERQALAMMDHPYIAKVLDGGMTDTGRPYFVMELVKGMPITQFCDDMKLPLAKRLDLFVQVCQAIQHAHGKGIIHRDIKPSNVMVTLHDGVPVPKVIDFGVAKATNAELTHKTLFTEHQQILGTPEYMSPEQTAMSGLDVDTRADIYSLGVLLYELLSGAKPFDLKSLLSEGYGEVLRTIREEDPPKPSTRASSMRDDTGRISLLRQLEQGQLGKALQGDLDWIVMRCLEKDRDRRYATAIGLATDIGCFLKGEPVSAAPPSAAYRMRKFVRRHKVGVVAGAAVVLALLLGIVGTSIGMTRAMSEAERAERAEQASARELARATEVKSVIKQMILGIKPEEAQGVDTTLLKRIVDQAAERLEGGEIQDERIAAELHMLLGNAYATIGEYEAAERHLPKAVEIGTRLLGAESGETLESRAQLALLRSYQGRYRESVRILEELIPVEQRLHGEGDERLLNRYHNLSTSYLSLFDFDQAETWARRAFEIAQRERGEEDLHTLSAQDNLGHVYNMRGKHDEAMAVWRRGLEIRRRTLGERHPRLINPLYNLSRLCTTAGDQPEAARLMAEARKLAREVLDEKSEMALYVEAGHAELKLGQGDIEGAKRALLHVVELLERHYTAEHRLNLRVKLLLARVYAQEARHDEAAKLVAEGMAHVRRVDQEGSTSALASMTHGADVYSMIRRHAEARDLYAVVYAARLEKLGPDHPDTLSVMSVLAHAKAATGDGEEAVTLAAEARERTVALYGPDDLRSDKAARVLALALARVGRADEAEAIYRESLARYGDESSIKAAVYFEFASHLVGVGKLKEGTELLRKRAAIRERLSGPTSLPTLEAKRVIPRLLHRQGQYAEAQRLYDEILPQMHEALGPDHGFTLETACWAAVTLGAQRRFEEAERLVLDASARLERQWGKEHLLVGEAQRTLGMIYMDWGRYEDAERCTRTAIEVHAKLTGEPLIVDLKRAGRAAMSHGAPQAAVEHFGRAVDVARRVGGSEHPDLVELLFQLADAERQAGNAEAALEALGEALPIARTALPASSPWRLRILGAQAWLYRAEDRPREAVVALREFVAIARETQGPGSEAELGQLMQLALMLGGLGDHDEALRMMRQGIADAEKRLGAANPHAGTFHLAIASTYRDLGKWNEAFEALDAAEPIIREVQGPDSVFMAGVHLLRASCLLDMGRAAEAVPHFEAAVAISRKTAPPDDGQRLFVTSELIRAHAEAGAVEKAEPLLAEVLPYLLKDVEVPEPGPGALLGAARNLLYADLPRFHDPKRALELARTACGLAEKAEMPTLWDYLVVRARAEFQTGDAAGANRTLARAIDLAPPGRRPALHALAKTFTEDGDG